MDASVAASSWPFLAALCRAGWPGQASYVLILGVRTGYVTTDEHGSKESPEIMRVAGTSALRGATRPTEAPRDLSVRSRGPLRSSQQARIL